MVMGIAGMTLLWSFLTTPYQRYEPALTADSTPVTMVPAVEGAATRVSCRVGLPQGTVCYFVPTPTPPGVCPTKGGLSGYCIYDGPRSLTAEPSPTPDPSAVGAGISAPYAYGGFSGTPVPIGDTVSPEHRGATPTGVLSGTYLGTGRTRAWYMGEAISPPE